MQAAANALTVDLVEDVIAEAAGGNIGEAASELLPVLGGPALSALLVLGLSAIKASQALLDAVAIEEIDEAMIAKIKEMGGMLLSGEFDALLPELLSISQPLLGPGVSFLLIKKGFDEGLAETFGDCVANAEPKEVLKALESPEFDDPVQAAKDFSDALGIDDFRGDILTPLLVNKLRGCDAPEAVVRAVRENFNEEALEKIQSIIQEMLGGGANVLDLLKDLLAALGITGFLEEFVQPALESKLLALGCNPNFAEEVASALSMEKLKRAKAVIQKVVVPGGESNTFVTFEELLASLEIQVDIIEVLVRPGLCEKLVAFSVLEGVAEELVERVSMETFEKLKPVAQELLLKGPANIMKGIWEVTEILGCDKDAFFRGGMHEPRRHRWSLALESTRWPRRARRRWRSHRSRRH